MAHLSYNHPNFPLQETRVRTATLPKPKSLWQSINVIAISVENGLERMFPKASKNTPTPKKQRTLTKQILSLMIAFPDSNAQFSLPYNKRYIDALSLQKILSIKAGSLQFKRAFSFSVFTNRRAVIFTGSGHSAEEAKFMADIWYKEWRNEQKHKNVAVKVLEKTYHSEQKELHNFYCELKIKYAFKIIRK